MMRTRIFAVLAVLAAGLSWALAAEARPPGKPPLRADRIVVEKARRRLTLMWQERPVKVYRVALGGEPVGKKRCEGDGRTPEGIYRIDSRNARSAYHRALHVSYPNAEDAAAARRQGCSPGGAIMIHGLPNGLGWIGTGHRLRDWTQGCIALTDKEIEEVWAAVPNGTAVEILP